MDPQSANNLDPKLKETYDRVMGTSTQPAQGAAPAPAAPAPEQPAASAIPGADVKGTLVPPTVPQAPNSTSPAPAYTADNLSFQAAIQQSPMPGPAQNTVAAFPTHQTSSLLKFLYIIGGIVFFVVYTIVWIKIFNMPLPF